MKNEKRQYVLTKENITRIVYSEERPKKEKEFCCKLCYNLPWRVEGDTCTGKYRIKKYVIYSRRACGPNQRIYVPGCGLAYKAERLSQADTEMTLLKSNAGRDNFFGNFKK